MDLANIGAIIAQVAGIGWFIEKVLRLLNDVTPEGWKWDDNLADLLANILKAVTGKNN